MLENKELIQKVNKKEAYTKAVKYNLRTFLRTTGYDFRDKDDAGKIDSTQKGKSKTLGELVSALDRKTYADHNTYTLKKPHDKLYELIHTESDHLDP